jgi:membrane protease YdiL (CAAX protease family)
MTLILNILTVTIAPLFFVAVVFVFFPILSASQLSIIYSTTLGVVSMGILTKKYVLQLLNTKTNFKAGVCVFFSIYLIDKYTPYLLGPYDSYEATGSTFIVFVASVILAPITEEIAFRAGVYEWLKEEFNPTVGVLISSAIWAACHVGISFTEFTEIFLSGCILCVVFDRYGLRTVVFSHLLINLYYFI